MTRVHLNPRSMKLCFLALWFYGENYSLLISFWTFPTSHLWLLTYQLTTVNLKTLVIAMTILWNRLYQTKEVTGLCLGCRQHLILSMAVQSLYGQMAETKSVDCGSFKSDYVRSWTVLPDWTKSNTISWY